MNRLILSIMTLVSGSLFSCGQQNFKTVDANEFETVISSDSIQLLDVRTAEEFNEAHIDADSVINIDKLQPDFMTKARKILKRTNLLQFTAEAEEEALTQPNFWLKKDTR